MGSCVGRVRSRLTATDSGGMLPSRPGGVLAREHQIRNGRPRAHRPCPRTPNPPPPLSGTPHRRRSWGRCAGTLARYRSIARLGHRQRAPDGPGDGGGSEGIPAW